MLDHSVVQFRIGEINHVLQEEVGLSFVHGVDERVRRTIWEGRRESKAARDGNRQFWQRREIALRWTCLLERIPEEEVRLRELKFVELELPSERNSNSICGSEQPASSTALLIRDGISFRRERKVEHWADDDQ